MSNIEDNFPKKEEISTLELPPELKDDFDKLEAELVSELERVFYKKREEVLHNLNMALREISMQNIAQLREKFAQMRKALSEAAKNSDNGPDAARNAYTLGVQYRRDDLARLTKEITVRIRDIKLI